MALYRPTNIIPSTFSGVGNGTVDITEGLRVSWQVEGASPMLAYQLVIQKNDVASTAAYDSGKVTLATPFYGTDYRGESRDFAVDIPAASLTTLQNGYADGYKLTITQWWTATDFVAQVQPAFFITRARATLTINAIPAPLPYRVYTFSAAYAQAQGDSVSLFRWTLAQRDGTVLKDTGGVYGTADIRMDYDGLFNGDYKIRCVCQTENGVEADSGWVAFSVAYAVSPIAGTVLARTLPAMQDAVMVASPSIVYITGTATGSYTAGGGNLQLPAASSVLWNQVNGGAMSFPTPWSVAVKVHLENYGTVAAFSTTAGVLALKAEEGGLRVTLDTVSIGMIDVTLYAQNTLVALLTPTRLFLRLEHMVNGLYPCETLYPSETLYPTDGTPEALILDAPLVYTQTALLGMSLYGPAVFGYLWALRGNGTAEKDLLMNTPDFVPEYGSGTLLLADFQNGLSAGNLVSPGGTLLGIAVYRMDRALGRLQRLADVSIANPKLLDYSCRNQREYSYYFFPMGETTYISQAMVSNVITPHFWNWTLLVCETRTDGSFRPVKQYVFRNNVTTDAVGNNNNPVFLKNFTPYPRRQTESACYKSSVLTALIGRVDFVNNCYVDSCELADELLALSVDNRPKFLKDRKGNLLRVETAAPVSMRVGDVQAPQPYTMALPWAEVGEAEDASIAILGGDVLWPADI